MTANAAVARLLGSARHALQDARTGTAPERFATAHLAALRAAAAILASKQRQPHRKPTSVWVLLAAAEPGLREWAERFAASAGKRAAAQAGIGSAVTEAEADAMVGDAATFVDLVAKAVE